MLKLALALQIGFLRMTGRLLEAVCIVPPALWQHLGEQFGVAAPDLASLRIMYQRRRTLFEHQEVVCEALGFHWLSEAQRRARVRVLRDELARTSDRGRLLQFARHWLYEHRLIVLRERDLRTMIVKAIRQYEGALARSIVEAVDPLLRSLWQTTLTQPQASGATMQSLRLVCTPTCAIAGGSPMRNLSCSTSARPVPPSRASFAMNDSRLRSWRWIPMATRMSPWRSRSSSALICAHA